MRLNAAEFARLDGRRSSALLDFLELGVDDVFVAARRLGRLGLLGAPSRMAQAAAPLAFGLLIDVMGSKVLIVSSALRLAAFAALFLLDTRSASRES